MKNKENKQSEKAVPEQSCGVVRNIRVSVCEERDYRGEREYRTVFGVEEIEGMLVDVEVLNKRYGEICWKGKMTVRLFRVEGEKAQLCVEQESDVELEESDSVVTYTEVLNPVDFTQKKWDEGIYRVVVEIDGVAGESEDIHLIAGDGVAEHYFHLLHAGLDRICEETEEEARGRAHSFQFFDAAKLKNIRLFLMARNLLESEWVYEFLIRVVNRNGSIRAVQVAKANHFMRDEEGGSVLGFGIDLGDEEDFVRAGEYTAIVSCFGQVILQLGFGIGEKDVPYDFAQEIAAGDGLLVARPVASSEDSVRDKNEIMDKLYRLVGLRKVKEEITQMMNYAEFVNLRRQNGFGDRMPSLHLIFTGHPGTGKNTVAEMIGELYCKLGVLSNGRVNHFKRQDLVKEGATVEEQLVRQALKKSQGGVLFVDEAGDLFHSENPNDRGIVALGLLYSILMREQPDVLVILADEEEEINVLAEALTDLQKVFTRRLCFEDYTPDELMEITRLKLDKLDYRFSPAAEEKFYKQLKAASVAREIDFTNGQYIDEQLENAAMNMSRRLMVNRKGEYKKEDLMLITEEDIIVRVEKMPGKLLEKLNAMVGLGELKNDIVQHLNYIYFIRERQKHGFTDVLPPLNMIFSGHPGTGKTTVAKMMGEIFHSVGILERPNIVVQDGRNLVGDTGVPPQQMAAMLMNMSAGGVLYIDHADALPQSETGVAVLEGLLANLSPEEAGDTVVVLGGYPDQIARMLETNPPLSKYFPSTFHFNDYTPEELMEIAENQLKEKNFVFHPKAKELFGELIRRAYEKRDKNFGNALLVGKIVEMAIRNMSKRTMQIRQERELTRQEVTTIRRDDIPADIFEMPKFDQDVFAESGIQQILTELDQMVGQTGVKKQIRDFVELAKHYSREGIKLSTRMSLQWCFTGNSAMGKGTVARIIARLYKAMGVVMSEQVIGFKVEHLIGLTEEEAQRSIGEALSKSNGGLLLFDEDSPKLNEAVGFRERVHAILMNQMAERPGTHIVIYAQPKNVVTALNGDAEHLSELINVLNFEDYSKEELMVILKRRLEKENMKLTTTARQYMTEFISTLVATEERSHASSRLMRIVGDMIVRNCLQRVSKRKPKGGATDLISVQKQDVMMFTEQFVAGIMKERKRIGFV